MENIPECAARIRAAVEQGRLQEALDLVDANLAEYGNHPEFLKAEALLCGQSGEYDTAIRLLKKAAEAASEDGEIYYFLSQCYETVYQPGRQSEDNEDVVYIDTNDRAAVEYTEDLNLYTNREETAAMIRDTNAPLVTIYFLAYNNLEKYTRPAIEALLKYTRNIDYELVLVDNGSTDGTLDYFRSLQGVRKRICHVTKNIGSGFGMAAMEIAVGQERRGKYTAFVANDILVTRNWLRNLLICIESDEHIGFVVPMSDNTSNCQTVAWAYEDFEDMQRKAALFNVSDPRKWEERLRLIPTVSLCRSSLWNFCKMDTAFIHNFSDDDWTFQYRRMGYKLIMAGDTFVHHAGSSVIGERQQALSDNLAKGRMSFKEKYYGVDAWGDTWNFEFMMCGEMAKACLAVRSQLDKGVKILGIDVLCGMPVLQLKNNLRKSAVSETRLSAFTQDAKYWLDLKTICDQQVICAPIRDLGKELGSSVFDAILFGKVLDEYDEERWDVLLAALGHLSTVGYAAFKIRAIPEVATCEDALRYCTRKKKIAISDALEGVQDFLAKHGYHVNRTVPMVETEDERYARELTQYLQDASVKNKKLFAGFTLEGFRSAKQEYIVIVSRQGGLDQ